MNGCRATKFNLQNIKSIKVYAFKKENEDLKIFAETNQTQCPIQQQHLHVFKDGENVTVDYQKWV